MPTDTQEPSRRAGPAPTRPRFAAPASRNSARHSRRDLALRIRTRLTKRSVRATHPMNLEPAPRLNKMPWFVASAVCFTVFLLIGLLAPNRFDTVPLVISVSRSEEHTSE